MQRRHWLGGWVAITLAGCRSFRSPGASGASSPVAQRLATLMVERLGWMKHVAAAKRARGLPVEDPVREAALLASMEVQGRALGLPASAVRGFFTGQMQAAKIYQVQWLESPRSALSGAAVPDLATTVRPALDAIGRELLVTLAQARQSVPWAELQQEAERQLRAAGYDAAVRRPALRGLELGWNSGRQG